MSTSTMDDPMNDAMDLGHVTHVTRLEDLFEWIITLCTKNDLDETVEKIIYDSSLMYGCDLTLRNCFDMYAHNYMATVNYVPMEKNLIIKTPSNSYRNCVIIKSNPDIDNMFNIYCKYANDKTIYILGYVTYDREQIISDVNRINMIDNE